MKLHNEPPKSLDKPNELTFKKFLEFSQNLEENEYSKFIQGKTLALVGPSPSLEGNGDGKLIDSFDLVVRVNKGYPVPEATMADVGTRTDIHYHCFYESAKCGGPIHYDRMIKDNIFVCCPYPRYVRPFNVDIERFEKRKKTLRSHYIDTDFYLNCARLMHTRPNSGIGAILDIMAYNVKTLYVTGFTFFQDGWRKSYKDEKIMEKGWKERQFNGTHAQGPQMDVVLELYQDRRLVLDKAMRKVLSDHLHSN